MSQNEVNIIPLEQAYILAAQARNVLLEEDEYATEKETYEFVRVILESAEVSKEIIKQILD